MKTQNKTPELPSRPLDLNLARLREEEPNSDIYKEVRITEQDGVIRIVTYNSLLKETRVIDKDGNETVSIDSITEHERTDLDQQYEDLQFLTKLHEDSDQCPEEELER